MSNMAFLGGPLDGHVTEPEAPMEEAPEEDAGAIFKAVLADIRMLLQSPDFSEQQRLELSKAESLLQKVKAQEEKEQEQAMSGKFSPGIIRKLGSGAAQ